MAEQTIVEGDQPARAWTRADTLAITAVAMAAAVFRFGGLATPDELVFDEIYYAKDSCWYALHSLDACDLDTVPNEVHPPLGKWFIAAGIKAFGFEPLGWRLMPAVAGTLTVALLYLLARRLFGRVFPALLASGLLAFCFLHLVQSRTSMLDAFVPLFTVAAFLFAVYDRDRLRRRVVQGDREPLVLHPWRWAAGAAAGAAAASKWSGGLSLVGVVALTAAWYIGARRTDGLSAALARLRRAAPSFVVAFGIVPFGVYLATYIGRIAAPMWAVPWSHDSWFAALWRHHTYMYDFHAHLDAMHSYQSPAWTWLFLKRPVSYFFCAGVKCDPDVGQDIYREIIATGNPFVWWSSLVALAALAVAWLRRRDPARPDGIIVMGFAVTYLPWLLLTWDRSAVFLFYLMPVVPFMMLAIAWVTTKIGRSWEARAAIALFVGGTLALFAYYHPLLTARGITQEQWRNRIWIFDNCDTPAAETVKTTVTETQGGRSMTTVKETTSDETPPPEGWCWI